VKQNLKLFANKQTNLVLRTRKFQAQNTLPTGRQVGKFQINLKLQMKPPRPWKGGVSSFRGKVPASRERLRFLLHSSPPLERRGILKREIKNFKIFDFENWSLFGI